ncbi:hypothetical protein [Aurantiacibacter spongiae]|uniref:Uncharacterized protein n=1 Tax=Aurantiacibacter spongiae TaxID=2488860 RepID=A0A3N5CPT4_9SPHN|nr:hypothetical protein [Aurantiacibacter spongiae]RPF70597.1 hypothetical protein EG799_02375 [Aurantiacibacter spongiae]
MKIRNTLLGALAIGSLAIVSVPASADTGAPTQDVRDIGHKKKERRETNGVQILFNWLYKVVTDQG